MKKLGNAKRDVQNQPNAPMTGGWQQYPVDNTPEQNGIPSSGTPFPEELYKTPQQIAAEKALKK